MRAMLFVLLSTCAIAWPTTYIPPQQAEAKPAVEAKKPPKAFITFQAQSAGQLLDAWRKLSKAAGGEKIAELFEAWLQETLDEKGLTGLDTVRPLGGYLALADELAESQLVFVLPIGKESDFLELLERLDIDAESLDEVPGVYILELPPSPGVLRFHEKHAYIGVSIDAAAFTADALISPTDLFHKDTSGLFTVRMDTAVVSKAQRQSLLEGLDAPLSLIPTQPPENADVAKPVEGPVQGIRQAADLFLQSGATLTLRMPFDRDTVCGSLELDIEAKPGSLLAKFLAARKPATNRFAHLVTPETAAATLITLPSFGVEVRTLMALIADELANEMVRPAEDRKEITKELLAGIIGSIRTTGGEFAHVVVGPDKNGSFCNILAVTHNNPAKVEKALRDAAKLLPKDDPFAMSVKFDVAKAEGTAIHTLDAAISLFGDLQLSIVAEQAEPREQFSAIAFTKDAIYMTTGTQAVAAMKQALAAKPGGVQANAILVNPKRWAAYQLAVEGVKEMEDVPDWIVRIGKEDRLQPLCELTTTNGETFRLKLTLDGKLLPMLLKDKLLE